MNHIAPEQPQQGFAKRSKNIFLTDNKSDEMMGNVLDLFPNKQQYIFQGKEGEIKKQTLKNKVREKFNSIIEDDNYLEFGKRNKNKRRGAFKKIGRAIKTAALAPARGAFLGLVRLNFRASASRFNLLNEQGLKKLYEKWDKLGGKRSALENAIEKGKNKKILACGKKCRASVGKNPQLPKEAQSDFVNFDPTTNAALIAAGGTVLATMIATVSNKSNYKSQIELANIENETAKTDADERKIDDTLTPQEKALAEEIIKSQEGSFDAVKAITENSNLTAEEKTAALEDLKQDGVGIDMNTKILIGVSVLAALGVAFYLYKQNNKN